MIAPLMQNRFCRIFGKVVLGILLVLMLGLPILQTWKMIAFLASILALIYSDIIFEKKRIIWGVALVVCILTVKSFLPVAGIEEGHNIFLVFEPGMTIKFSGRDTYGNIIDAYRNLVPSKEHDAVLRLAQGKGALQQSLPAAVYNDWRREFNSRYPPMGPPYGGGTWLQRVSQGNFPDRVYAYSSDALWRPAKYSRKVDDIAFSSLAEFRGGFANDLKYNFYGNDPITFARNFEVQLPFFVMYEFSEQSVGCTLLWQGTVFWQKNDGSYEKISHTNYSGRTITASDAGKRIYALNLPAVFPGGFKQLSESRNVPRTPQPYELAMNLKLSPKLAVGRAARDVLSIMGIVALIVIMMHIKWKSYVVAINITALSLIIIGVFIHYSNGKFLGYEYPPQGGGDDGIVNESWGRDIARATMNGDISKAFEGNEPIYWFTPGMRYARSIEKNIFGDTNLGYTAFVALLPYFLYLLIKHVAGYKWGLASALFFVFLPLGSFSFLQYIQNAKLGYAEAMGFGLFIFGLYLFMRSNPRWGGERDRFFAFIGGMFLAASMFLRPNFVIAVAVLGLFFLYGSWRIRDFTLMGCASAGLALAFLMPIHNLYFGHQFYLISKAGTTVSVTLSPMTYLQAGQELLAGNWKAQHINEVIKQLSGWLWTLPRLTYPSLKFAAELFMIGNLVTLAITVFIAFRPSLRREVIFVLAWTALAAHLPMLFIYDSAQFRYAMLAWDLSAILTIVIIAKGLLNVRIRRIH